MQYFEGVVHRILYPLQVAVGVKGSGPKIVFGMRGMMERYGPEGGVLRKVDVVNAYQEFDREDCVTVIDDPPRVCGAGGRGSSARALPCGVADALGGSSALPRRRCLRWLPFSEWGLAG